jgi:hypothetical protein
MVAALGFLPACAAHHPQDGALVLDCALMTKELRAPHSPCWGGAAYRR